MHDSVYVSLHLCWCWFGTFMQWKKKKLLYVLLPLFVFVCVFDLLVYLFYVKVLHMILYWLDLLLLLSFFYKGFQLCINLSCIILIKSIQNTKFTTHLTLDLMLRKFCLHRTLQLWCGLISALLLCQSSWALKWMRDKEVHKLVSSGVCCSCKTRRQRECLHIDTCFK